MVVSELDLEEVPLKCLKMMLLQGKKETLYVFQFALLDFRTVHLLRGALISAGNRSVVPNRSLLFCTYQKSQH